MTNRAHKHTVPGNHADDSQPPTRKEVNQVVFRFVLFLAISIWLLFLSLQNGFPNADVYPDHDGRSASGALPLLAFPLIVTAMLGAELVRFYRRARRASQPVSSNEKIKNEP